MPRQGTEEYEHSEDDDGACDDEDVRVRASHVANRTAAYSRTRYLGGTVPGMTDQPSSIEEAADWARQAADLQAQADSLLAGVQAALPTLRAEAGVSQTVLSTFSGVAANYVSRVESGARGVTPDALVRVTEGLQSYVSHGASGDLARARGKERTDG